VDDEVGSEALAESDEDLTAALTMFRSEGGSADGI
jgi:hypothetical protein